MADPNMLFDLNLKDADLHEALGDFFRQAGRAYVFEDIPDGHISVRAADLGFHDALVLLLPTNFEALEIDGVYHIHQVHRPPEQLRY